MDLVFKVITAPTPTVPQVQDTTFQEHYSGVNRSMAWDEITPGIRQATEQYVLDFIGEDFYNDLAAMYQAGTTLSDEQKKTLELLQDCIANYAIYHILPEKRSILESLGVVENTPQGGSSPAAYPIYKEKRRAALENGDKFLDRLLSYMEKQVTAGDTGFDMWKESSAYTLKTCDFFRHTTELDEFLNIQNSRRSFISLTRYMKQIEEDVIRPIICDDLYALAVATTPLEAEAKLLPMIKKAVAYLGAAEAIPHHRIVIDGDGFRVVSQTDGWDDRRNMTNNVHETAIQALATRCQEQGRRAVAKLVQFLEDNIADYPDYENSTCRTKPVEKAHSIRQASDGIGAVGFF
jgi:hypothetical protein